MFNLYKHPLHILMAKVKTNAKLLLGVYIIVISLALYYTSTLLLGTERIHFFFVFSALLSVLFMFVLIFFAIDYFKTIKSQYSLYTQVAENNAVLDILESELTKSTYFGSRIGIGENHLFTLKSSFYIPYAISLDEIIWVYSYFPSGRGGINRPVLCVFDKFGNKHKFMVYNKSDEVNKIIDVLQESCPNALIGNTAENKNKFLNIEK